MQTASIHPEWQQLSVGDRLTAMGRSAWTVAVSEPERFLGLRASFDLTGHPFDPAGPRPRFYTDSLWGFLLKEPPGGRTRLVVSGYWAFEPRWLQPVATFFLLEPTHWIMQMREFANLKRYGERDRMRAGQLAARGDVRGRSPEGEERASGQRRAS